MTTLHPSSSSIFGLTNPFGSSRESDSDCNTRSVTCLAAVSAGVEEDDVADVMGAGLSGERGVLFEAVADGETRPASRSVLRSSVESDKDWEVMGAGLFGSSILVGGGQRPVVQSSVVEADMILREGNDDDKLGG